MTAEMLLTMQELDSRVSDGIHVRLLWCAQEACVAVAVADNRTGDSFTIAVRDGDHALDVFHHPYAYAAWYGVETRSAPVCDESAELAAA